MPRRQTFVQPGYPKQSLTLSPNDRVLERPPAGGIHRPKYVTSYPAGPYQKGSPGRPHTKITGPKKTPGNLVQATDLFDTIAASDTPLRGSDYTARVISMDQFRNR